MKEEKKKRIKMFLSMIKIGCVGFGGGSALIPVIEKEVVDEQGLVEKSEYDKDVIVASITPGALPVEIATGLGKRAYGLKGMVLSAVCMAFPGALLTVLFLSVLSRLDQALIRQIEFLSVGIAAFICCLLTSYVHEVVHKAKKENRKRFYKVIVIIVGVFALTCGKSLYTMIGVTQTPIFAISTIRVLGVAFFGILYTRCKFNKTNVVITVSLSLLYIACVGKSNLISNTYLENGLKAIMALLAAKGVYESVKSKKTHIGINWKRMRKEIIIWAAIAIIFAIPAVVITKDSIFYLVRGFVSSLISFGGGDAYLTVADGMFVDAGFLTENEFYGHLISLVNVLPGSILCKTLSGIGFFVGYHASQNVIGAYIVALSGFACSIVASGGVFCVIYHIYESFEKLDVFILIRRWIRPIIAGLLLTVMLSLVNQNFQVAKENGLSTGIVFGITLFIFIVNVFLYFKKKLGNGTLIITSVVSALVLCNAIYMI